jgi:hypothetical protein
MSFGFTPHSNAEELLGDFVVIISFPFQENVIPLFLSHRECERGGISAVGGDRRTKNYLDLVGFSMLNRNRKPGD